MKKIGLTPEDIDRAVERVRAIKALVGAVREQWDRDRARGGGLTREVREALEAFDAANK